MPICLKGDLFVGYEHIDNDHLKIVDLVNSFETAVGLGYGQADIQKMYAEIIELFDAHLGRELQLMRSVKYPELDEHEAAHSELFVKLTYLSYLMEISSDGIDHNILEYFQSWLKSHVLKHDMKLAAFLRQTNSVIKS